MPRTFVRSHSFARSVVVKRRVESPRAKRSNSLTFRSAVARGHETSVAMASRKRTLLKVIILGDSGCVPVAANPNPDAIARASAGRIRRE
eukprot:30968-Pelagococcus_subviridis.AAC.12